MSKPTPTLAPDLPAVPRARTSRWAIAVAVLGAGVLVGFAGTAVTGRDGDYTVRDEVPSTVRASPGGYRTFHFWHSGYSGGK